jgi:hypothetical protein
LPLQAVQEEKLIDRPAYPHRNFKLDSEAQALQSEYITRMKSLDLYRESQFWLAKGIEKVALAVAAAVTTSKGQMSIYRQLPLSNFLENQVNDTNDADLLKS